MLPSKNETSKTTYTIDGYLESRDAVVHRNQEFDIFERHVLQYFSVFAVPDPGATDTAFEISYETDGERVPWYEEKFYSINTSMNFHTFVVFFFLICATIPACLICYCCYKR